MNGVSELLGRWVVGRDLAVDLGTTNTLVYVRGRGVVLDEPSVVAVDPDGRLLAVGLEARRMVGRTPAGVSVVRPVRDGVIVDLALCQRMLRTFVQRVHQRRWLKPRVVVSVPVGVTAVERRAVQEAVEHAGARRPAHVIADPVAAAIGAGLPVQEAAGRMVVDIGGGTTQVAAISLGGVVVGRSSRVAGDALDEAIVHHARQEHALAIGPATAEEVKINLGSAWPLEEEVKAHIGGRDLVSGLPAEVLTSTEELRDALEEPVSAIVDAVVGTLDRTPPELVADILESGIVLSGGGALLLGLGERLEAETGMPVVVAEHPYHAVVVGSGQALERFEALRDVVFSPSDR